MAGVQESLIRTGDGVTSYRADGAGPPLILLHGLQIGQELFDRLREHLQASFTVITYDQRDRGNTTFEPAPYTVADLADDLASLIEALGYSSANVLGTSFGGMVAQSFALRHANLLDGLVLGATSQTLFRPDRVTGPVADLLAALEDGDDERARGFLAQMVPAASATSVRQRAAGEPDRSEGLIRRFAATRAFNTSGKLGAITAETLVIHGRDDSAVPHSEALSLAAEIRNADLLFLAKCGHSWENEQPARAAAAIASFLVRTPLR